MLERILLRVLFLMRVLTGVQSQGPRVWLWFGFHSLILLIQTIFASQEASCLGRTHADQLIYCSKTEGAVFDMIMANGLAQT